MPNPADEFLQADAASEFLQQDQPQPIVSPSLPPMGRPPIPLGLRSGSDALDVDQDIRSSTPDPLTSGYRQAQTGVNRLTGQYPWSQGPSARYAQGASEVIRGTAEAALPFVGAGMGTAAATVAGGVRTLPQLGSAVRQALPVARNVAAGIGAQYGVEKALTKLGAPQGVSQLAGDVAGSVPIIGAANRVRGMLARPGARPPAGPVGMPPPEVTVPPPPGYVGPPTPYRQPEVSTQPPPSSLSDVQRMQSLQSLNERLPVLNRAEDSAKTLMAQPQPKSAVDSAQVFESALATKDAVDQTTATTRAQDVRRHAGQVQPDTPYIADPAIQAAPPLYSIPQPKSAIESAQVFEQQLKARDARQQSRQSQPAEIPEEGPSIPVQRAVDARQSIAQEMTGKPWEELNNPDRLAVDDLVRERLYGAGGSREPKPLGPTGSSPPPIAPGIPTPSNVRSAQPETGRQLPIRHPITHGGRERGAVNIPPLGPKMKAFREGFQNPEKYSPNPQPPPKPKLPPRERRPLSEVTFSSGTADNPSKDVSMRLNVDRMNIDPEAKFALVNEAKNVESQRLHYESTGGRMSWDEVVQMADEYPELIKTKTTPDDRTLIESVRNLNARRKVAAFASELATTGKFTPEHLDAIETVRSLSADLGRGLRNLGITADPKAGAGTTGGLDALVSEVLKTAHKSKISTDQVLSEAAKYDLRDPEQATKFYRTFIKPSMEEWVNALRYSSMLSSPVTQTTNIMGNLTALPVRALTKAVEGGVDAASAAWNKIRGREATRTRFTGEAPAYIKGAASSLSKAATNAKTFYETGRTENPDFRRQIPLTTKDQKILRPVERVLTTPQRFMETMDQFFMTLAKGGETAAFEHRQARGVEVPNLDTQASQYATHSLFRSPLGKSATGGKQGHVLDFLDYIPRQINEARNSSEPMVRFASNIISPFVTTPTNIFKQGVEYSPAGWTTLAGHADKTGQAAKAAIGTAAAAAAGLALLAAKDQVTWAEPANPKAKAEFRASGRIPYAVRIGDKWVQFSKLHPSVAYPLAMVANVKDLYDSGQMTDDMVKTFMKGMARQANFLADQTTLASIGGIVSTLKGDEEGMARTITSLTSQVIPHRALVQWTERFTDPVQRKADTTGTLLDQQWQQLKSIVPGLADTVPARTDKRGVPVPNQDYHSPRALSPARISNVDPKREEEYLDSRGLSATKSKLTKADAKDKSQADRHWQQLRSIQDPTERYNKTIEALRSLTPKDQDPTSPDYKPTPGQRHLLDLYNHQDWTSFERDLGRTRNDLKAKTIYDKLQTMAAEDRGPRLQELTKKGIITADVERRLRGMGLE